MAESTTSVAAAPQARHAEASLLDQIVEQSKVARSDVEHARAKDIISELVREVMQGTVVVSDNLSVTLDARVAELDRLISAQLSEVMHNEAFQKLESSWTGLHYLCASYQNFFRHVDRPMRVMAAALRSGRTADEVMLWCRRQDDRLARRGAPAR